MRFWNLFCGLLITVASLSVVYAAQSVTEQASGMSRVPPGDRAALAQAVNRMVELQESRDWEKVYELLPDAYKTDSKASFVKKASRGPRLIEFFVDEVTPSPIDQAEWVIFGCGTFQRDGRVGKWESFLSGKLFEGHWSVSMVMLSGGERGLTRCRAEGRPRTEKKMEIVTEEHV